MLWPTLWCVFPRHSPRRHPGPSLRLFVLALWYLGVFAGVESLPRYLHFRLFRGQAGGSCFPRVGAVLSLYVGATLVRRAVS